MSSTSSSSGTSLVVPLNYTDRRLAALSAVQHRSPVVRRVHPQGRDVSAHVVPRWVVEDVSRLGGWRRVDVHEARALQELLWVGAVRVDGPEEVAVLTGVGEVLGPLWLAVARASGRQATVLRLVRVLLEPSS
jgi:hypothetical protein